MEDIDSKQLDRSTQSTWLIEDSELSSTAMVNKASETRLCYYTSDFFNGERVLC